MTECVGRPLPSAAPATNNPLLDDPVLRDLLNQLESLETRREFGRWKESFLNRFDEFLDSSGSAAADQSYRALGGHLGALVKTVKQLNKLMGEGKLAHADSVSVKARQVVAALQAQMTVVIDELMALIPGTADDAQKLGYTKFHMGAVLIRDSFDEYDRLYLCDKILQHLREALAEVVDRQVLAEMKRFGSQLQNFCGIMADLGLYDAMVKCHQLKVEEAEEEEESQQSVDLVPTSESEAEEEAEEKEPSQHEAPKRDFLAASSHHTNLSVYSSYDEISLSEHSVHSNAYVVQNADDKYSKFRGYYQNDPSEWRISASIKGPKEATTTTKSADAPMPAAVEASEGSSVSADTLLPPVEPPSTQTDFHGCRDRPLPTAKQVAPEPSPHPERDGVAEKKTEEAPEPESPVKRETPSKAPPVAESSDSSGSDTSEDSDSSESSVPPNAKVRHPKPKANGAALQARRNRGRKKMPKKPVASRNVGADAGVAANPAIPQSGSDSPSLQSQSSGRPSASSAPKSPGRRKGNVSPTQAKNMRAVAKAKPRPSDNDATLSDDSSSDSSSSSGSSSDKRRSVQRRKAPQRVRKQEKPGQRKKNGPPVTATPTNAASTPRPVTPSSPSSSCSKPSPSPPDLSKPKSGSVAEANVAEEPSSDDSDSSVSSASSASSEDSDNVAAGGSGDGDPTKGREQELPQEPTAAPKTMKLKSVPAKISDAPLRANKSSGPVPRADNKPRSPSSCNKPSPSPDLIEPNTSCNKPIPSPPDLSEPNSRNVNCAESSPDDSDSSVSSASSASSEDSDNVAVEGSGGEPNKGRGQELPQKQAPPLKTVELKSVPAKISGVPPRANVPQADNEQHKSPEFDDSSCSSSDSSVSSESDAEDDCDEDAQQESPVNKPPAQSKNEAPASLNRSESDTDDDSSCSSSSSDSSHSTDGKKGARNTKPQATARKKDQRAAPPKKTSPRQRVKVIDPPYNKTAAPGQPTKPEADFGAAEVHQTKQRSKILDYNLKEANIIRDKLYRWYARMGQPDCKTMKRLIAALPPSSELDPDDVDLLPWVWGGRGLDVKKVNALVDKDFEEIQEKFRLTHLEG